MLCCCCFVELNASHIKNKVTNNIVLMSKHITRLQKIKKYKYRGINFLILATTIISAPYCSCVDVFFLSSPLFLLLVQIEKFGAWFCMRMCCVLATRTKTFRPHFLYDLNFMNGGVCECDWTVGKMKEKLKRLLKL